MKRRPGHVTEYKRVDDDHAWRVVSENGHYMAVPGEGYRNLRDMRSTIWSVGEAIMRWMAAKNPARFNAIVEAVITATDEAATDEA